MSRRSTSTSTRTQRVAERRRKVAALYLRGVVNQYDLARQMKVSQFTISTDLAAVRELWMAEAVADYNTAKNEELVRLARLELEAWEAWDRSKRPAETTHTEKADGGGDSRLKARRVVEQRDGDPRFLTTILDCIKQRCAIRGLDAPKQLQVLGAVGVSVTVEVEPALSPDELLTLAALAEKAGVLGPPPQPQGATGV